MPKRPRIDAADLFYHVVARGNKRQTLFFDETDFRFYKQRLIAAARRFDTEVFRYVLMPNHIHLLLRPRRDRVLRKLFLSVQRSFAWWYQKRTGQEGPVWQGRYWNSVIEEESYLLACARYIEMNPVRARLVSWPADYEWSSARAYLLGEPDPLITFDPGFLGLGETEALRRKRYLNFVEDALGTGRQLPTLQGAFWSRPAI